MLNINTARKEKNAVLPLLQALPQHQDKISPCRVSCPLENPIPQWLEPLKQGNYNGAWQLLKGYNPFPAITGFSCYRFCEGDCNRAHWDESVEIGALEKGVGLWRLEHFGVTEPGKSNEPFLNDLPVAIVGSGPAGLSCAFYLRMLGADVTVFEKLPVAGGLLATGIPESRLPRDILARELEILQAEGVVIRTGIDIGRDITRSYLEKHFAAVVLATGAQEGIPLNVKGEELGGVLGAVDFLRAFHLAKIDRLAGPVVVTGGGNAALDAAVAARHAGAKEVTLIYRRSREEMPAHPIEIEMAEAAGVSFLFQAVITDIEGEGSVEKIVGLRTAPSPRGQIVKMLTGTTMNLPCRTLLIATGQQSSLGRMDNFFYNSGEKALLEAGKIQCGNEGFIIMATGDSVNGPQNVAGAIFSGRQAALNLMAQLKSPKELQRMNEHFFIAPPRRMEDTIVTFESLNPAFYPRRGRAAATMQEAARCFSCGFCNNCGVCYTFCPDLAVEQDGGRYDFLPDYCKSCNICIAQCPANALTMLDTDGTTSS